jgi:hypothetical protein
MCSLVMIALRVGRCVVLMLLSSCSEPTRSARLATILVNEPWGLLLLVGYEIYSMAPILLPGLLYIMCHRKDVSDSEVRHVENVQDFIVHPQHNRADQTMSLTVIRNELDEVFRHEAQSASIVAER